MFCDQFLDQVPTKNHWSLILDSLYSTISSSTLSIMNRYVIHHQLRLKNSLFTQIHHQSISQLMLDFLFKLAPNEIRTRNTIRRVLYPRFNMFIIKQILRKQNVRFVHFKHNDDELIIGVKNALIRDEYRQRLSMDTFDRHYFPRDKRVHQ
ncbi:unnamed protein product [Rotaria socialis]|uniref:Uncharacterized protein n=1 Tax=Rotaria socialis TaxID=392032 RepID=A0A821PF03_9BILA|nr:unnamed protein product [Rotaria socialis]